jgi:general secretion pathway protein G
VTIVSAGPFLLELIALKNGGMKNMESGYRGFKLFELLLIAAVLGSIGMAVIPPLTQASTEDHIINVISILHQVRSQIDLYKAQHKGMLPPAHTPEAFEKAMTQKDAKGYGPYMEELPLNPFNNLSSVRVNSSKDWGAGTHGWHFNSITGDFHADDSLCHSQL